jgi:hypothetical protein
MSEKEETKSSIQPTVVALTLAFIGGLALAAGYSLYRKVEEERVAREAAGESLYERFHKD